MTWINAPFERFARNTKTPRELKMSYKVLMAHLQTGADNAGLLAVTADLAKRFDASVIGIAACQPVQLLAEEGFVAGEVIAESYAELKKEIAAAEAQFRSALGGRVKHLQWRSAITYLALANYLAEQARAADLIITGKQSDGSLLDSNRAVNVGALVLQAGRPVLVVPEGISSLPMEQVFLGWKDSREARRAAADALPLLAMANASLCWQSGRPASNRVWKRRPRTSRPGWTATALPRAQPPSPLPVRMPPRFISNCAGASAICW